MCKPWAANRPACQGATPPWTPRRIANRILKVSRSESRRAELTISFRVTLAEGVAIENKARKYGLSVGLYAKAHVLSDAGLPLAVARPGPPRDANELRKLVAHIGKIGSNMNQIAKFANAGQGVDRDALMMAIQDLGGIRSSVASVLKVRDP